MTIEEAIKGIHTLIDRISLADDRQDAIAMAIRSLEAWEKVRAVIKKLADDEWNKKVGSVSQGLEDALEIIDEHLAEVSE